MKYATLYIIPKTGQLVAFKQTKTTCSLSAGKYDPEVSMRKVVKYGPEKLGWIKIGRIEE